MHCRTCRHELSEYLDGRLATGRRALVADHLAACADCGAFWREFEQAQKLTLRLARQRVGSDFRERLFARIEAGEGTPTAVFADPVPLAAKLRYTFAGAAAAAALLVVASLLREDGAGRPVPPTTPSAPVVADAGAAPQPAQLASAGGDYVASAAASPLAPRRNEPHALLSAVKPLTSDLIAVEAARQFEQRHNWTANCLDLLAGDRVDAGMVGKVCDDAESLARLGSVLSDLRDAQCLSFADPQVDSDLRVFMSLLDIDRLRQDGRTVDSVRSVVEPALRKSLSLSRMTSALSVAPSVAQPGRQDQVMRLLRTSPGLIDQIFFVLPGAPDLARMGPLELSRTFLLSDDCGPLYVAPRSELSGPGIVFQRIGGVRIDIGGGQGR